MIFQLLLTGEVRSRAHSGTKSPIASTIMPGQVQKARPIAVTTKSAAVQPAKGSHAAASRSRTCSQVGRAGGWDSSAAATITPKVANSTTAEASAVTVNVHGYRPTGWAG